MQIDRSYFLLNLPRGIRHASDKRLIKTVNRQRIAEVLSEHRQRKFKVSNYAKPYVFAKIKVILPIKLHPFQCFFQRMANQHRAMMSGSSSYLRQPRQIKSECEGCAYGPLYLPIKNIGSRFLLVKRKLKILNWAIASRQNYLIIL